MSLFPNTPVLEKAALIAFEAPSPLPKVIEFQFNPETISRSLKASTAEGGAEGDAFRLGGAPQQTIKMDCIFDATERIAVCDPIALKFGVQPEVAALEGLIAPKTAVVVANTILLNAGVIEILPTSGPFLMLAFGRRLLPVRMSGLEISEESFDAALNPIRVKISLDFTVMTYSTLEQTHPGYTQYLTHQAVTEAMSLLAASNPISANLAQRLSAL